MTPSDDPTERASPEPPIARGLGPGPGGRRTRTEQVLGLWRWAAVAALGLVLLAVAAAFHLEDAFSLDGVRRIRAAVAGFVLAHERAALAAYFALYLVLTMAAVPGTLWLIVLAGLLFGVWPATAATVVAGSLGGFILFLAARRLRSARLRARVAHVLGVLETRFKADEALWLLSLRIAPFVPYPVANIAPAFIGARIWTFAWTTVAGLVPTVFLYTSIGVGLDAALAGGPDGGARALAQAGGPLIVLSAAPLAAIAIRSWLRRR